MNPDNNYKRGAVVAVKTADPFSGDLVCSVDQLLGGMTLLPSADSVAQQWQEQTKSALSLDADIVKKINADLQAQAVQSITGSLSNPVTYDLTDVDIVLAAANSASANCVKAIRARQSAGQSVTIINRSIGADATYTVNWNTNITADAKATFSATISGDLSASAQGSGSGSLTGKGLTYGVTDSTYLLQEFVQSVPKDQIRKADLSADLSAVASTLNLQMGTHGDSLLKSAAAGKPLM